MNSDDTGEPFTSFSIEPDSPAESPSRRYWRAAIAHLYDPHQRDAAWEFYLRKLEARKGGDTMSALVLLLEANGALLMSLPEKIHKELLEPFSDRLATMKSQLTEQEAHQREMLTTLVNAAERTASTNANSLNVLSTAEGALRKAATSMDAGAVVRGVKSQLEEEALQPFKRVLKDLAASTTSIGDATTAAETAVTKWRRVHLGGVALGIFAAAMIVSIIGVVWSSTQIRKGYERRFAAVLLQMHSSREALNKLAEMGIAVRITAAADSDGNPLPNAFAVVIGNAEATDLRDTDGRREGIVFIRPTPAFRPSSVMDISRGSGKLQ